jgi:hypothetical protein
MLVQTARMEICSFEYGTPPPGDNYLVIGHEALAEIVEAGSAVEAFGPGIWSCRPYAAVFPSLVPGVPIRASGLLLHRRLPGTWHHGSTRLPDRIRRRS